MFQEAGSLSSGSVVVDEKRLIVGERSFSLEGVRNVEVMYRHRSWTSELSLLAGTALFAGCGLAMNNSALQIVAVALLMVTGIVFWNGGPRYAIALDMQNGRITPLTSSNRILVESVGQFLQSHVVPSRALPLRTIHTRSFSRRRATA